jgi:hypothetical protein
MGAGAMPKTRGGGATATEFGHTLLERDFQ